MESIVQTSSWRQGATERHIINLLDDLIGAEEALTELAARGFGQGPMWTVMKTKPNPITNGELLRTMGAIIGCLGDRLSLLEPEAHIFKERVALGHGLGNSRHPDLTVVVGADAWRIPTIDHAERCLLKRSVEGGVVDVFCPRKPSDPLARTISCHATKIHTDGLVHRLSLPVCLWVERRTHEEFGA